MSDAVNKQIIDTKLQRKVKFCTFHSHAESIISYPFQRCIINTKCTV